MYAQDRTEVSRYRRGESHRVDSLVMVPWKQVYGLHLEQLLRFNCVVLKNTEPQGNRL